jgi:predicted O-methyltransferase YrrM
MAIVRDILKRLLSKGVQLVVSSSEEQVRNRRDVDLCLLGVLAKSDVLTTIGYPVEYVEFLRSCIEYRACSLRTIRAGDGDDSTTIGFMTLVDVLGSSLPSIELAVAEKISILADQNRRRRDFDDWTGDAGLSFALSSSSPKKGRILSAIVRFTRSKRCLELGTGYGMSALFILSALNANGSSGQLLTVEGSEPRFSLASGMLRKHYGDMVSCRLGAVQDMLRQLANQNVLIDFLFHDSGHTRDDYVGDFEAAHPILAPGAVVLFDDIRLADSGQNHKLGTYQGWRQVVQHPRVRCAFEIDNAFGLLLLR